MKKRRGFPWRFHGAGEIECLRHHPGVVVYAGTCAECMNDIGKTRNARYPSPGCVPADDPYGTELNRPIPAEWEIVTEHYPEEE